MTMVVFASLKGSPGVTTLASLVGATWPVDRRVVLTECDSFGGDLAPRFSLSTRTGWSSLVGAARRGGPDPQVDAHLQTLPGGLEVLVAAAGRDSSPSTQSAWHAAEQAVIRFSNVTDVIVDHGRLPGTEPTSSPWLHNATDVCLVVRNDPASIVHVRDRSAEIRTQTKGSVRIVLVGAGIYSPSEVRDFTGLDVVAQIPEDRESASVASTGRGSHRRLERSGLVAAAGRLTTAMSSGVVGDDSPSKPGREIDDRGSGRKGGFGRRSKGEIADRRLVADREPDEPVANIR